MKNLILILLLATTTSNAQVLERLGRKVEQKAKQRVERKLDETIEKGLDKAEDSIEGKNKKASDSKQKPEPSKTVEKETAEGENPSTTFEEKPRFSSTSKFDFVPGEKIIAIEDFSQDEIGDFPAKWNTNSSGEIMKISSAEGKWLALTGKGSITPEFIQEIPENCTIEFDLVTTPNYDYYSSVFQISIAETEGDNGYLGWQLYGSERKKSGVSFTLHPQDAGSAKLGRSEIITYDDGATIIKNDQGKLGSFNHNNDKVHVAIWRQNQRIRVYVGENKIWDLPRAFKANTKFNTIVFSKAETKDEENYFISNIRVAVGNPDTRNKFMETGKYSTTGIHFTTGSDQIKPESHGVIKQIATLLEENPEVKIKIIGHTDNTGNDANNLKLSKDRAQSVKEYLTEVFKVNTSRMEIDGRGSSEAVGDNSTSEGKAQNRRVEFIKM